MTRAKILIVDDDPEVRGSLAELLVGHGYEATAAARADEALECCREATFHLALVDLQLPDRSGLAVIRALREACPATRLVLITGHGSIRTAVTALRRGAFEYLTKPLRPKRLLALVHELTADAPPFLPNALLADGAAEVATFGELRARSSVMRAVFERARRAARSELPLLVVGESGTGKERLARAIHAASTRADGPFVLATPGELERSWAAAARGTLFVDDLGALDAASQLALLPLLGDGSHAQGRRPAARVAAALPPNPTTLVDAGRLRADLYHRVAACTLEVPPLRERPEDVPLLAGELVREAAQRRGRPVLGLPSETVRLLVAHAWPGNVRELRNVIEQAVLLAHGDELVPSLLPQMLHRPRAVDETLRFSVGTPMDTIEREVILRTLSAHEGNKTAAAEALGISRRSIYNKLAEYDEADRRKKPR